MNATAKRNNEVTHERFVLVLSDEGWQLPCGRLVDVEVIDEVRAAAEKLGLRSVGDELTVTVTLEGEYRDVTWCRFGHNGRGVDATEGFRDFAAQEWRDYWI